MDKWQAITSFWSGFGLPAYDENTIPESAKMPYITYESQTDSIGSQLLLTGSLFYRSTSWAEISQKADEIGKYIESMSCIKIDNGAVFIAKGEPFAQRMSDEDSNVRRILINIQVEFLTN